MMPQQINKQDSRDEIEYSKNGDVLRIRLRSNAHRRILFGEISSCLIGTQLLPIYVIIWAYYSQTQNYACIILVITIFFGLFRLYGLWKSEWLGAEFIVSDSGIERRFPSGKTCIGLWKNLNRVKISRRQVYFYDGMNFKLRYGMAIPLSDEAWNIVIDKLPKDSLLAVACKDWQAFNDDAFFYKYGRIVLIILFSLFIVAMWYFEAYSLLYCVVASFIFLLFLCLCLVRNIVFCIREFQGLYSVKQPMEK